MMVQLMVQLMIFLQDVKNVLFSVGHAASELGLQLNRNESEIICKSDAMRDLNLADFADIKIVDMNEANILGSPIGNLSSVDSSSQPIALILLRNSLVIPKLLCIYEPFCIFSLVY